MVEVTPGLEKLWMTVREYPDGSTPRGWFLKNVSEYALASQAAAIRAAIEACAVTAGGSYHGPDAVERIRALSVEQVIERAMTACANAGHPVGDHFQGVFPQTGKNPKGGGVPPNRSRRHDRPREDGQGAK